MIFLVYITLEKTLFDGQMVKITIKTMIKMTMMLTMAKCCNQSSGNFKRMMMMTSKRQGKFISLMMTTSRHQ